LGASQDATKAEFSEQSALVGSLEESGAKGMGDLKDRAEHALVNESKNPRSSVFIGGQYVCAVLGQYLSELFLAADQRR
jgi:hypothetical protein